MKPDWTLIGFISIIAFATVVGFVIGKLDNPVVPEVTTTSDHLKVEVKYANVYVYGNDSVSVEAGVSPYEKTFE